MKEKPIIKFQSFRPDLHLSRGEAVTIFNIYTISILSENINKFLATEKKKKKYSFQRL